jgi:hypothetical protein
MGGHRDERRSYAVGMAKVSRRGSLARGRAWPVATADVKDALGDLFDAVSLVWYDRAEPQDDVAWVNWHSEASRHPRAFAADENSATVWLVPSSTDEAGDVGELLRAQVLPQVAEWLRYADGQDEAWQALNHSKSWSIRGGELTIRAHDQSPKPLKDSQ